MTSLLLITSHYFQLNCFAILLIDDYHNVHAKKVPTKLITSTATHMASCLLDIHPTIPAVKITIKGAEVTCYGGIENTVIQQKMHQALVNMKKPFINQLHIPMLHLSPKQLQEVLRQLRQASKKSHKPKFSNICTQDNKKIILSRS